MSLFGDILGPVLAYKGTQDTNETNKDIASANNAWSAEQYATRYQTMTKDLQSAGLNPMLAYSQSPGSAPSAQAVSFQNPMSSALEAYHKSSERDVMAAQVNNIAADSTLKAAQAAESNARAKLATAQTAAAEEDERVKRGTANQLAVDAVRRGAIQETGIDATKALAKLHMSQVPVSRATISNLYSQSLRNTYEGQLAKARITEAVAKGEISSADVARARNDERYEKATGGVIRQTSRDLGTITGAAVNARRAGMTKR